MLLYPDTELREPITFIFNLENSGGKRVPLYIISIKLSYDMTNDREWSEFRKDLKNVVTKLIPILINEDLQGLT